jgi:hypothetical protein
MVGMSFTGGPPTTVTPSCATISARTGRAFRVVTPTSSAVGSQPEFTISTVTR